MKSPIIKPVKDNISKGKTYSELIKKYNDAINNGYYAEAEFIVYAYLEDRLRSFIYYSEGLDRWNSIYINENMRKVYGKEASIKNISTKIDVIKKSLKSTKEQSNKSKDDYYVFLRKIYYASVDINDMLEVLKEIEKWCDYRNEIVHAMFNKDISDIHRGYAEHVENGFKLARYIDVQVGKLKKA